MPANDSYTGHTLHSILCSLNSDCLVKPVTKKNLLYKICSTNLKLLRFWPGHLQLVVQSEERLWCLLNSLYLSLSGFSAGTYAKCEQSTDFFIEQKGLANFNEQAAWAQQAGALFSLESERAKVFEDDGGRSAALTVRRLIKALKANRR